MNRATNVHFAITCDIEMVTDACKSSCQVAPMESLYWEIPVVACCRAMNYQEGHLSIVLIKTARCHASKPMQAFKPNTPASADAMAITTLMIMLQVEFDFFSM